jgi:two-component system nitrogen regulation sensor histidine kinase NtrY
MVNARLIAYFLIAFSLLAFSVYWRSLERLPDIDAIVKQIERNVERESNELKRDADAIRSAITNSSDWPSSKYVFLLYDSIGVIQWNSNVAVPDTRDLSLDTLRLVNNGGSQFLAMSLDLESGRRLNGYILLQERYAIQNQYLRTALNPDIFPVDEISINQNELGRVVQIAGENLFQVSFALSTGKTYRSPWLGWLSLIFGSVLLLWATRQLVKMWGDKRHYWLAAIFVFLIFLLLRVVMVYGGYPGSSKTTHIFDPAQFASSTFNDSIGNFFLNSLAFGVVGWIAYSLLSQLKFKAWHQQSQLLKLVGATFFLILAFAFHLLPFLYLETIFHNSTITVDISQQLYADPVRLLAFGCVVLSNLVGFYFFYAFYRSAIGVIQRHLLLFICAFGLAALGIFIYHVYTERSYEIPLIVTSVHVLILFISSSTHRFRVLATKKFSMILLALMMFSAQTALTLRLLSQERQQKAMLRYGNSFLVERDVLGEYLLSQAVTAIGNDAFIQRQFTNPFNRMASITQKIKRSHLNNYFDRYEVKVALYDSKGNSMSNAFDISLDSLRKRIVPVTSQGAANVFIDQDAITQNLNHYVAIIPVQATVSGFVTLDVTLREVSPVMVFPRLMLDDRFSHYASGASYSHAVYYKGALENSSGDFKYELNNFKLKLSDPQLLHDGKVYDGYLHVALEDWAGRVAVVSARSYTFFNLLTNFSFYLLLGLVVCFMGYLLAALPNVKSTTLSYSGRIQLYVYLAIVLPLVVIGSTTLRLNSVSEQDRAEAENMAKANRLAQNLAQTLLQEPDNLQDEVLTQAKAVGVDATVFSPSGMLMATSQPDIYATHLMSRLMSPDALQGIKRGDFLFTSDDAVGKLNFRNTYAAIRSSVTGEILAILSVPYFESMQTGELNQLRLASNIWTVFALVFLFFYLLSFVALNWLTRPLQVIAASLRRTTLSGTNRKLSWNSRDEIGVMVDEYNKLVDNLEISKAELARKQREAAWREMARQVAHEIKNPLTPIKLTLQQMEKTMREGTEQTDKNIQSIKSVLHQVDILNGIASSFSAFAQMPELKLERTDIRLLLQDTVAVYHNTDEHAIQWNSQDEPVWVMADTKLFVRIFGNIVLNAFQTGEKVTVEIGLKTAGNNALISFTDNGPGIQPEIVDKVFIPYFSTKETGSGLGLAIAKQGVEQAGGRIWCESVVGKGTTFFISLPIA